MAAGMTIRTVLNVFVIVIPTLNIALWAFRPSHYASTTVARRWAVASTVAWVISLPVVGAVALALGGTWQADATGAVALACWPVTILALRKRHVSRAAQQETGRLGNEQLAALPDERGRAEVDDLVACGKATRAVRRVRELTGLPLIDAKRLADSLRR
jgi:hypothetical protein